MLGASVLHSLGAIHHDEDKAQGEKQINPDADIAIHGFSRLSA